MTLKEVCLKYEKIARSRDSLRDQAVASLLHSKDPVEVQRAGIIIREIPCSIGWRIRDDEKAHL
jgi:hypothetical protein